ncbi:MAG: hypothetical protein CL528_11480 [Aequorivita sp.]|nr:hypothetical protein [Aequorivita sp.]MBP42388.1 hypothetical protein [Aequorivita sp.]|tara:strand:- start:633 stop:992 length:360 start_codon:yes stop_codon:yes gene_type:complete
MSETTQKIDIKEVSSFKLKVELQARSTDEKSVIPELTDFTEEDLKAELKSRHELSGFYMKINLDKNTTDIMMEGEYSNLIFLLVRASFQNPEFLQLLKDVVKCANDAPSTIKEFYKKQN